MALPPIKRGIPQLDYGLQAGMTRRSPKKDALISRHNAKRPPKEPLYWILSVLALAALSPLQPY
jgi:hypothetical protein